MTRSILIHISVICIITLGGHSSLAQEKFNKKAEKFKLEGDKLADFGKYIDAIPFYNKAIEISKDYSTAYQRLAHVYIQLKNYNGAYLVLNRIIQIGGDFPNEVYFRLAQASFALGKFSESEDFLFQYEAVPRMSASRKQEVQELKDHISFARKNKIINYDFQPWALDSNINTRHNEYFPSLTADGKQLYFTRHVKENGISQEDIFVSTLSDSGLWSLSASVSSNINTKSNEGAHSISADGKFLYFTMCEQQGGYGGCDIYVSEKKGDIWGKPKNAGPEINSSAKETQPCLSADGMALYFVSSRPGGYGKLDIWMSYKKPDGKWGTPINVGSEINTAGIEERPYIHPDNETLYFASDGRKGMGNADLYIARRHPLSSTWNVAENMGFPINSFHNESGLFVTADGNTGYFATDRFNTQFNLDIISFSLPEHLKPQKVSYVKGKVSDSKTNLPLAAELSFIDIETGKIVNQSVSDSVSGNYLITLPLNRDYVVHGVAEGHLFYSQYFSLKSLSASFPFFQNISLIPFEINEKIILENIFYEKDSFALQSKSMVELKKIVDFLNKNSSLKIEIGGHTDRTGNKDYNDELSTKRAKSVYEYLINQNIDKNRVSYKGYGFDVPLNQDSAEVEKSKNRRTELKILAK